MFNKQFMIVLGIGFLLVAGAWYFFYAGTKDMALAVNGEVLKVRTIELSPHNICMMTDFRIRNSSDIPFVLKDATIFVIMASGKEREGHTLARSEAEDIFKYTPLAGPQFNKVLAMRDKVPGKVSVDRMVGATFDAEEKDLVERKSVRLHLVDLDGKEFDLFERKTP